VCALAASLLLAAPFGVAAQEPVDLAVMTRIRDEGFRRSKVMETVGYLTDVIGPRLTGSPQAKQALDYTRSQLESWGLANARLEPWGPFGRGWSCEYVSVRMVAPSVSQLIAVPKAWTPGTNGIARGKVVRLAKMPETEADFQPYKGKLAGLVVLVGSERKLTPLETGISRRYNASQLDEVHEYDVPAERPDRDLEAFRKQIAFQASLNKFFVDEKALAVVEESIWDRAVVRVSGGGSRQKDESVGVPNVVMAIEHTNRIHRLLDRKTEVELEFDVRTTFHDGDGMSANVIAELPGTDKKDEVVMIGAHIDSWHSGTGATDNAAGTAVAMEALRILKAIGVRPRRTVRVGLWTGEEQGLLGSRAYVAQHFASRPEPTDPAQKALPSFLRDQTGPLTVKPEHAKLSLYINLDNGTGKIRGVYLEENAAVMPLFKSWLEPFADLGATTMTMNSTRGTDHVPFDSVGLPGFQFIQDPVEYRTNEAKGLTHHSNMDVFDRVVREDLMQAAVVMAGVLYNAAMRSDLVPRKPMPVDPAPRR
jgi:carboxypeptidase Q